MLATSNLYCRVNCRCILSSIFKIPKTRVKYKIQNTFFRNHEIQNTKYKKYLKYSILNTSILKIQVFCPCLIIGFIDGRAPGARSPNFLVGARNIRSPKYPESAHL